MLCGAERTLFYSSSALFSSPSSPRTLAMLATWSSVRISFTPEAARPITRMPEAGVRITIPSVVPFTLQTFAVVLILGVLGGKRGTLSILLYIILGLIGIPVFSGFRGGPAALFGTTGGYIIGFLLTGLLWIALAKAFDLAGSRAPHGEAPARRASERLPFKFIAAILGLAICYFFGTVWFMILYTRNTGAISIGMALAWCVIPFLVPDVIKLVLAVLLSGKLKKLARIRD